MTIKEVFRQATRGKGILQYILACLAVGLCFPIGLVWTIIKAEF